MNISTSGFNEPILFCSFTNVGTSLIRLISSLYGDAFEFSKWGKQIVDASEDITKAYKRVDDLEPMARFDRPRGIKIDASDRIYVVDSTRCRIQVYSKVRQYNDPQFNL